MIKALLFDRLGCVKLPAGGGVAPVHVAGPRAAHRFLRLPTLGTIVQGYQLIMYLLRSLRSTGIRDSIEHI